MADPDPQNSSVASLRFRFESNGSAQAGPSSGRPNPPPIPDRSKIAPHLVSPLDTRKPLVAIASPTVTSPQPSSVSPSTVTFRPLVAPPIDLRRERPSVPLARPLIPPPPPPARRSVSPNVPPPLSSSQTPGANGAAPAPVSLSGSRSLPGPSRINPHITPIRRAQELDAAVKTSHNSSYRPAAPPPVNRATKPKLAMLSSDPSRSMVQALRGQLTGPVNRGRSHASSRNDDDRNPDDRSQPCSPGRKALSGVIRKIRSSSLPKQPSDSLIREPVPRPGPPPLPARPHPDPPAGSTVQVPPSRLQHHGKDNVIAQTSNGEPCDQNFPDITEVCVREPAPPIREPIPNSQDSTPGPQKPLNFGSTALTAFIISNGTLCATGAHTLLWDLQAETLRRRLDHDRPPARSMMSALAFKPTSVPGQSELFVWLGSSDGAIHEFDVMAGVITGTWVNPSGSAKIVAIHRMIDDLWSIDADGRVCVWRVDDSGGPSLTNSPQTFNAVKGHTFSLPIGNDLWYASGQEIRVYSRSDVGITLKDGVEFPLKCPGAGSITGGSTLSRDPDTVYFCHSDGHVSTYDRRTCAPTGLFKVTSHRISHILGVGDYLWLSVVTFSNSQPESQMQVYDTRPRPWRQVRSWDMDRKLVTGLAINRETAFKSGMLSVAASLSHGSVVFWDGHFGQNWIDQEMSRLYPEYCTLESMSVLVTSWNIGAVSSYGFNHSEFFQTLIPRGSRPPDIVVFGFQEVVDLTSKKQTAKDFIRGRTTAGKESIGPAQKRWRVDLQYYLNDYLRNYNYLLLHENDLVGLFLCVFVKAELRPRISLVSSADCRLGLGGLHGNKGALALRFAVDDTSICLINCHLAAGQEQRNDRNQHLETIIKTSEFPPVSRDRSAESFVCGGDGTRILDHEVCIINGDMNYRIDSFVRHKLISLIEKGQLDQALARDQLLVMRDRNPDFVLRAFGEMPIRFKPTYKYDVGTDRYDTSPKQRLPAWCDRILVRTSPRGLARPIGYGRLEFRESDHRPVSGMYEVTVKKIAHGKRREVLDRVRNQSYHLEQARVSRNMSIEYLRQTRGYDYNRAAEVVDRGGGRPR